MPIHSSVLELIADTPIVKAQRLDAGVCELYLKMESANPGGSIKIWFDCGLGASRLVPCLTMIGNIDFRSW